MPTPPSPSGGRVLVALPDPVKPLARVRSTLLVASRESLRQAGLFAAYEACLAPDARASLAELVAGTWVDVADALAHYEACDALGLPTREQEALGTSTFDTVRGTLLGTAARTVLAAATPEWMFEPINRFWARAYDGSALGVTQTGPKEARVILAGSPLVGSAYFRNAARSLGAAVLSVACKRCYLTELRELGTPTSAVVRVQWV